MKILKGSLKRRNIAVSGKIRPVSVRVKKACFDILGEECKDKIVLDLFAGSGSLGIEALSVGAKEAVFVDIKKSCVETIKRNISLFRLIPHAQIYLKDAFCKLKNFCRQGRYFDIIFLDPPYYREMLKKSLQILEEYDILAPLGYIVCFCYLKDNYPESSKFSLILTKKYGQTLLLIYQKR